MLRALLLLASLMVVAGGAAMVNGSSMILNERGWSQLIAGSVVLTGGFVVAALAGVLYQFQLLWADKTHRSPQDVVSQAPASGSPEIASQINLQTPAEFPAETSAQAPDITAHDTHRAGGARHTAFYETATSHTDQPHDHQNQILHAQGQHQHGQHQQGHQDHQPPARPHEDSAPVFVSLPTADYDQIKPVDQPSSVIGGVQFSPEPTAASREAASQRPQLKQPSLFEVVQEHQGYGTSTPSPLHPHAFQAPAVHGQDRPAMQETAVSAPVAEPKERILLASYSTGGVGYFMYSDQSIEAEMAIGRYRFNSMDELRRFIETQVGGERVAD